MFYDLYLTLCKEKKVTPTRAAIEIGISKATPTTWKKRGLTPQGETLNKIANYFGVSTDYLLGNVSEPYFHLDNDRIKREINSYEDEGAEMPAPGSGRELPHAKYREVLSEGGMRLLMDADAKLPEEHLEEIVEFIKMKQRKYGR